MNILHKPKLSELTGQQLEDIAELIYETDPYIYPAMFSSKEEAMNIIPKMIEAEDSMFNLENFFLAEKDNRIVALILWHRGPLKWSDNIYCACGGKSPYIKKVKTGYFDSYADIPHDMASIINVCVNRSMRNQHVGNILIDAFIKMISGPYELFVLEDNTSAIKLYENKGFVVTETLQGFTVDNLDLPCLKMEKQIQTINNV